MQGLSALKLPNHGNAMGPGACAWPCLAAALVYFPEESNKCSGVYLAAAAGCNVSNIQTDVSTSGPRKG